VFGGGQVPAEDDWVGATLDQRFERTDDGIEFRIFRVNKIASWTCPEKVESTN
jgi:hypothetical protein